MKFNRLIPCGVILLISFCVFLFGTAFVSGEITRRTRAIYGDAAPGLSFRERKMIEVILLLNQEQLQNPYRPEYPAQEFIIQQGEATANILGRLWEAGLIPDPSALRAYLRYTGLDLGIQAGRYSLESTLSPIQIAQSLQDATPKIVEFRILPGWRLEEIAAALPTSGLEISPEEFLLATEAVSFENFALDLPAANSAEGFLAPGLYEFPREATSSEVISAFLAESENRLTLDILKGFERQGLNTHEAVTLASIVEREAVIDEEKPIIASVFINRLAAGIKLDADPTVQYAVGYDPERGGWWPTPLTLRDLEIDHPYNTYLYSGIPPGPIASPSVDSLLAVAFPAQTPYYYFRAACDDSGRHLFAETFQEQVENACP